MAQSSAKGWKAADILFTIGSIVATAAAGTFLGYLVGYYAIEQLTGPGPMPRVETVQVTGDNLLKAATAADTARTSSAVSDAKVPDPEPNSEPARDNNDRVGKSRQDSKPKTQDSELHAKVFYRVQVGAFSVRDNAKNLAKRLKEEEGLPAIITGSGPYRVQVGAFSEKANAQRLSDELKSKGYPVLVVQSNQ